MLPRRRVTWRRGSVANERAHRLWLPLTDSLTGRPCAIARSVRQVSDFRTHERVVCRDEKSHGPTEATSTFENDDDKIIPAVTAVDVDTCMRACVLQRYR
jgi:hypothetical protein